MMSKYCWRWKAGHSDPLEVSFLLGHNGLLLPSELQFFARIFHCVCLQRHEYALAGMNSFQANHDWKWDGGISLSLSSILRVDWFSLTTCSMPRCTRMSVCELICRSISSNLKEKERERWGKRIFLFSVDFFFLCRLHSFLFFFFLLGSYLFIWMLI